MAGEEASYFGGGAQSFPGIQPQNAVDVNRQNFGFYVDLGADVTDDLYVGMAARSEEYRFLEIVLRGKVQVGSRRWMIDYPYVLPCLPVSELLSLHQIYMSNIQTFDFWRYCI